MSILAIETATMVCASAIVQGGIILSEASLEERYVHAEKLMTQVDTVLRKSGLFMHQLDGIAISIGPGSFTGLRIGLSVAKGLAFAMEKPLIAVPTLQAIAQRVVASKLVLEGEHILVALDARRDEVYCQWFVAKDGMAKPMGPERDVAVKDLLKEAPLGKVHVSGDAIEKLQSVIGSGYAGIQWNVVPAELARCSAGIVGQIGEAMMKRGDLADQSTLEPKYIKEFFFRQHSS